MTDKLWVKRRYEPEDEDGVVYQWLKSYAHARSNREHGAHVDKSPAELRYWSRHAPVVEHLLRTATTYLICDPERAYATKERPAVIYAFACFDEDVIHYVSVKRLYAREGFGSDMVRDLLGPRLDRPCTYSHELPEMVQPTHYDTALRERVPTPGKGPPCGIAIPSLWTYDQWGPFRRRVGLSERDAA